MKKLIVAITGASGAIYGIKFLEEMRSLEVESHLLISKWGKENIRLETNYSLEQVQQLADYVYAEDDLAAPIASGSVNWDGMIVAPCSMKTLAGIAHGYTEDLITRAADVSIKENRSLILLTRETPLSPIHLENMLKLAQLGVTIMPPVPAFYAKPENLEDMVKHTVGRALMRFGIQPTDFKAWCS